MKCPPNHLSDKNKTEIINSGVVCDFKENEDAKLLEGAPGAETMVLQKDDNFGSAGLPLSDKHLIKEISTLKHDGRAELQQIQEIFVHIKRDFEELRKRFVKINTKSTDLSSKYRALQNDYQMLVEECQHEATELTEEITLTGLSLVSQDMSAGAQNVGQFRGDKTGCLSFRELLENLTEFVMKLKKLESGFQNQKTKGTLSSSVRQWPSAEGYLNVMNENESSTSPPESHSSADLVDQTSCDDCGQIPATLDDIESKLMILEGRFSDINKLLATSCFHYPHTELQNQNNFPVYTTVLPSSPSPLSSSSMPTLSQSSSVSTVSLKEHPQKQTFIGTLEAELATLSEEEQVNVLLERLADESALMSRAAAQKPDVQEGIDYHRKQVNLLLSAWPPQGAWNSDDDESNILNKCSRGDISDLHSDEINEGSVTKSLESQLLNAVVLSGILALVFKNMQTSSRQRIVELEQELCRTFHCEQAQEKLLINIREASSLHEVREQLKTLESLSLDWKNKENIERLQNEIINQWKHDSSVVEDYQRLCRCLKELQMVIGREEQEPGGAISSNIANSSNNTSEAGRAGDARIEMLHKELEQAGQRLYQRIEEGEKLMEQLTGALDVVMAGHAKCLEDTEAVGREAEERLQAMQNNFSHEKEHLSDTHKEEVNRLLSLLAAKGEEPHQASAQPGGPAALESGGTNVEPTDFTAMCERNTLLEKRIETLRSELDCRPPSEYVTSLRSKHQKELNSLKATCERGLVAMDEAHVRLVKELQRGHRRELTWLQHQQEHLLAEETAATVAAIEAVKNAHREELLKELEKTRRMETMNQTHDLQALKDQNVQEMNALRREIETLSEQYSQKCLESSELKQVLYDAQQSLLRLQQENHNLAHRYQGLSNRVAAHELMRVEAPEKNESPSLGNMYELRVCLHVKDSEIQYLKQEINSLKDELQMTLMVKERAVEELIGQCKEHGVAREKAERDARRLRAQLELLLDGKSERVHSTTTSTL